MVMKLKIKDIDWTKAKKSEVRAIRDHFVYWPETVSTRVEYAGYTISRVKLTPYNTAYVAWDHTAWNFRTIFTVQDDRRLTHLREKLERLKHLKSLTRLTESAAKELATLESKAGDMRAEAATLREKLERASADEKSVKFIMGALDLERRPGWTGHEVSLTFVDPEHQGKGIAGRLYDTAIIKDGLMVVSGHMQTKYSIAMWKRFVETERYTIWAHDLKDLERFARIDYDETKEDVTCELNVWFRGNRQKRNTDVRLIAVRP